MLVKVKLYAQSNNIPFAITLAQLKLNSRISKGSMMEASVPDFVGLSESGKGNELQRNCLFKPRTIKKQTVSEVEV